MATYHWRGSTGSFLLTSGWMVADTSGVLSPAADPPSDLDTVVFDGSGMTLAGDAEFAGLLQLALPLSGALNLGGHTLSLLNTVQFGDTSSRINGPGTLETGAISAVPAAGAVSVQICGGATWSNAGLVMDAGIVGLGNGAGDCGTIVNQAGALFALAIDQAGQIGATTGGVSRFLNQGTLAKTGGAGVSSITASVVNDGVLVASSGTLELDGGGMLGGMIGGDAGQVVLAGTYTAPSGIVRTVAFGAGAVLGAGADGPAVLSGPGTLVSSGPVQVATAADAQVLLTDGATWVNAGTLGAAADLALGANSTLLNQAGGSLLFSGNAGIEDAGEGGCLINQGTLSRTGSGISEVAVPVSNTGSILVAGGTLALDAGGTIAGPICGAGTLLLAGDAVLDNGGSISTGGFIVAGATLLVAPAATATVTSAISGIGGTLLIDGGGRLTLSGGIDASQTIAFAGTGGTLTVTDVTGFAPAAITGFAPGDALVVADSSNNVVTKLGQLEALAQSGELTAIRFTDAGTPALSLSVVQLSADKDALAKIVSPYRLASGVAWAADRSGNFDTATAWSSGTVPDVAADAVIDFADQPTVTYAGGTHELHTLSNIAGNFVLSGGTLELGQFDNQASLTWNGGSIALDGSDGDNSGLLNGVGAVLNIAANGQHIGGVGGLSNSGTMLVNGVGSVVLDTPLVNAGRMVVTQGTLQLNAGGASTTGITAEPGATLVFAGGSFANSGGYAGIDTAISGGTLDLSAATAGAFHSLLLSSGELALGGAVANSDCVLQQSGGTLSGSATFTAFAGAALSGGVQTGPGTTRLLGNSTVDGIALDGGRVLQNDGALNWAGGDIVLGAGDPPMNEQSGTLSNTGVLSITADGSLNGNGVLDNSGVIAVAARTGAARIDAALVNSGIVAVTAGTLDVAGPVSGSGIFQIGNAAVLDFTHLLNAGESIRFLGGGGTLAIEQSGVFGAPVAGFAAGDMLDLTALDFAAGPSLSFTAGTLNVDDGTHGVMVALAGSYSVSGFQLATDGHGGVLVGYA